MLWSGTQCWTPEFLQTRTICPWLTWVAAGLLGSGIWARVKKKWDLCLLCGGRVCGSIGVKKIRWPDPRGYCQSGQRSNVGKSAQPVGVSEQPVSFSPALPTLCRVLFLHGFFWCTPTAFLHDCRNVISSGKSSPALPDRISFFLPLVYLEHFSHWLKIVCLQASPIASKHLKDLVVS